MSTRGGKSVVVVLGREDSFAAGAADPDGFVIPFASVRFSKVHGSAPSDEIVSGANPGQPFLDVASITGELMCALTAETFPVIMGFLTGNYTPAGSSDPYSYVSKAQDADPISIWVERQHLDSAGASAYYLAKGVRMHSLKITATKKAGLLTAALTLTGRGTQVAGASAYDSGAVSLGGPRLNQKDVTVKVDGTTSTLIKSIDITIERAATPQQVMDGLDYAEDVALGGWTVKASVVAVWDSADTIRALDDDAEEHYLELIAPIPGANAKGHEVIVKLPEGKIFITQGGDITQRGPLEIGFDFIGYYEDNSDASSFVLTAINGNAATVYTDVFVAAD